MRRPWDACWTDPNTDAIVELMVRPTDEPLTLADARRHLRLTAYTGSPLGHPDDDWIETFGIPASREFCEWETGLSLAPQTFRLTLDRFPHANASAGTYWTPRGGIRLPFAAPLIEIDSLVYTDVDGNPQALVEATDYVVQRNSRPARVFPMVGATWPTVATMPGALVITYTAGYGAIGSPAGPEIPRVALAGIRLMLGHLYENREATIDEKTGLVEVPFGVRSWLRPINLNTGFA